MSGGHGAPSTDPRGVPRRDTEQRLKQELETVRSMFYDYQMRKDREMKEMKAESERTVRRYELQLHKTVQESKKISAHSTNQSKRIQELMSNVQEVENRNMQLLKEKEELVSDVAAAKATADIYEEDFQRERMDRERAAGRVDSLERNAVEKAQGLAAKFCVEMEESEAERRRLESELGVAREEVHAKASQVKQYKKQVETLQQELKDAQQKSLQREDVVVVELPQTQGRSQTNSKSHILGKSKTKEDTALKAQRKATMKAAKREREKSMREGKEKRKQKMDSMDEAKLREFLGNDINRLETENIELQNRLECSEATVKFLVEKLNQAEAQVKLPAATRPRSTAVQRHSHRNGVKKQNHHPNEQDGNQKDYVNILVSSDGPRKPRQRLKSQSEPQHEGGSRSAERVPRQVATQQQEHTVVLHDRGTRPPTINKQRSFDPALQSKDADYVNLPPAQTAPLGSQGAPSYGPQRLKAPMQPRAASVDSGYGGPLIPVPRSGQPTSMPAAVNTDYDSRGDISDKLDVDIRNKAAEVVEIGREGDDYTLGSSIPFDPYLECLYCNQQFRYGEIQKYRKHVLDCSGGSTV